MIGTLLNERYRVDAEIGQGGMGIVYRGYDLDLDREVAIKVLSNTGLGAEGSSRLLEEAQTAARLNHPNIVTVHDVGLAETPDPVNPAVPFIVMEYVEGDSLHENRSDSLEGTLAILGQVCSGLEHAHDQGVIHRDLKPENVVITKDSTAKLMDFGLARSVASRYTMEGMVAGTVFYLAPEQALGQEIDQRTDLYSLGVMMYELTTGELPYVDPDPIAVISQHLHAPVVPPRAKNPDIPQSLNELILKLMSKDPGDRPASAGEVITDLESLEVGEDYVDQGEEQFLLDRIVRGRIVGREKELNQARQLWQNAISGGGQLLLISGEPGIGKTRLVREIATQAEVSGGRVLVGECQAEGNAPYAPFAQVTRQVLRAHGGVKYDFPRPVLSDLLELSPELQLKFPDVVPNPELSPEAQKRRLFENVVEFCSIVSQDSPLLLVLEDIHWADSGSLSLLEHLARRIRQQQIMLLGTYRELELDEALPLHETLFELTRRQLGRRIKLERLNKKTTGQMLGIIFADEISSDFLDGIYKETEGNPFFVEEVSKALVENGQVWFENGEWQRNPRMEDIAIPQGVKVTLQSRINRLSDDTQGVLLTAAIIGREFDFETLAIVSTKDEDILIDCLEEGINKQLIEEVKGKGGERFTFSHALISATLRESISGLRRTRLHRQVAEAIEQLDPENFERLAYHWGEAGDEQRGLNYTIKAADRARLAYANEDAVHLYSEALVLLPEDHQMRFDLLSGRAAVYYLLADWESQLSDIEEMLRLAEEHNEVANQFDALIGLASYYLETEPINAQEPLKRALRIAGELNDIGREGRALYYLGRQAYFLSDAYNARDYFESSAAKLRQAGLIGEAAESLSFLSVALVILGEHSAALKAAEEAVDLSRESGDRLLEGLSLRRLGIAYMGRYQDQHALPIIERSSQIFHELGDIANEVYAFNVLGILKLRLGMFEDSEADFLKGLMMAESINHEVGIRWITGNVANLYNWQLGEYMETLSLIDDQLSKAADNQNESLEVNLLLQKSIELSRLGSFESALKIREVILPKIDRILDEGSQAGTISHTGVLFAEIGQIDKAERTMDQAIAMSPMIPAPNDKVFVAWNSACLELIKGTKSNYQTMIDTIEEQNGSLREKELYIDLGDALLYQSQLHLALSEEDQSHARSALECSEEAQSCFEKERSNWVMPEQFFFHHSRALRANGREAEADEYLRKAYERMILVAEKFGDEDLRRSYLGNVRDNLAIQEAYQERFG